MPTYKVRYKGEIHEIDWSGKSKPSKDELRLAISNDILKKEAPEPLSNKLPVAPIPDPTTFEDKTDEFGLPKMYGPKTEKFLSTPLLPDPAHEPDTYAGGYAKSLYKDFVQPLSTPRSLAQTALIGAAGKFAPKPVKPPVIPEIEPPPSVLHIPERTPETANLPIKAGSNTYGITPKPSSDPLLAHVPERYHPTPPTQQYFENMLPSRIREQVKGIPNLEAPPIPGNIPPSPMINPNEVQGFATRGSQPSIANEMSMPKLKPPPNITGGISDRLILPMRGAYEPPSKFAQAMNATKSSATGIDLSYPLRQGVGLIHKKEYWTSLKPMFQSLADPKKYEAVIEDIASRPNLPLYRRYGLGVFEREEHLASNLTEKIPALRNMLEKIPGLEGKLGATPGKTGLVSRVYKATNRAADAYIKSLRSDTFDSLLETAKKTGQGLDDKQLHNIAEVVNTATGRGRLGFSDKVSIEKYSSALNNALFSPKFIASRIQMLNPQYYLKLDPFTRKEAIKSTLALASFGTTLAGLSNMAGAKVSLDPTNSDFGKIKIGENVRLDPYAGLQQYIVFLSRFVQGKETSPTSGKTSEYDNKYNSPNRLDLMGRLAGSKLNPVAGLTVNVLRGHDFVGTPVTWKDIPVELIKSALPMYNKDVADVLANEPELAPVLIPAGFGMGLQRFSSKPSKKRSSRPSRSGK